MPPNFHPAFRTNYYFGIDACTPGVACMANFEGVVDDDRYLDSRAAHHLTKNIENMYLKEEQEGIVHLIIENNQ